MKKKYIKPYCFFVDLCQDERLAQCRGIYWVTPNKDAGPPCDVAVEWNTGAF